MKESITCSVETLTAVCGKHLRWILPRCTQVIRTAIWTRIKAIFGFNIQSTLVGSGMFVRILKDMTIFIKRLPFRTQVTQVKDQLLWLTVYGGGINPIPSPNSRSLSKLSWLVAIDGSELAFTNAGKLPNDSELDGPGPISRSLSGLDAYDRREVFMGKRKSSDKDSTGYFTCGRIHIRDNKDSGGGILLERMKRDCVMMMVMMSMMMD